MGRKKKGSHFASLSFSPSPSSRCRVTFPRSIRDRVEIIRESDTDPRSEESFLRLLILHFTLSLHFTSGLQSAVCVLHRPAEQHFLKVPTPINNKRFGHFPLSPRCRKICIVSIDLHRLLKPIDINRLIFIDYINYIDWFSMIDFH